MPPPGAPRGFDKAALPSNLPAEVAIGLSEFTNAALAAFGDALSAIVLFGSAAEGRLRATSDVNVLLVLRSFEQQRVDQVREAARTALAAIQLHAMFVLTDELPAAAEAFAVKFHDILNRRIVLAGEDPFRGITIPRARIIERLRQDLLNTSIRLRATYVLVSLREEQLAREIAEAAAPLRAAAAAIVALEGKPAPSPKEALAMLALELPGGPWIDVLDGLSDARADARLPAGVGAKLLMRIIDLAVALRERAAQVPV